MSWLWDPTSSSDYSYTSDLYFDTNNSILSNRYMAGMPVFYNGHYYAITCLCYNNGTYIDRSTYEFYITNLDTHEDLETITTPIISGTNSWANPSGLILYDGCFYFNYLNKPAGSSNVVLYIVKYDISSGTLTTIDSKSSSNWTLNGSCAAISDGTYAYFVFTVWYSSMTASPPKRVYYWVEKVELSNDTDTQLAYGYYTASNSPSSQANGTTIAIDGSGYVYYLVIGLNGGIRTVQTDGTGDTQIINIDEEFCIAACGSDHGLMYYHTNGPYGSSKNLVEFDSGAVIHSWAVWWAGHANGVAGGYTLQHASYPYNVLLFELDDKQVSFHNLTSGDSVDGTVAVATGTANWAKTLRGGGLLVDVSENDIRANTLIMYGGNGVHGINVPRAEVL